MKNNYTKGSGNVYKDLGYPNPAQMLKKAKIIRQINIAIEEKKLSQTEATKILDITPWRMSLIEHGVASNTTLKKLNDYLRRLSDENLA